MNIEAKIRRYDKLQETLGAGADAMEIGSEGRTQFISNYRASIAKEEKEVAEWLHNNYEEIAKGENWNTQESCKVDFDNLPEENKKVMLELSKRILSSN